MGANRIRGGFGVGGQGAVRGAAGARGDGRRHGFALPARADSPPIRALLRYMVARKGAGMYPQVVRPGPLNVLTVLADDALDVAPLLGAFRGHCALVCTSPAQGVEAARRFEADVALIDLRAPDPAAVARARRRPPRPASWTACRCPRRPASWNNSSGGSAAPPRPAPPARPPGRAAARPARPPAAAPPP